MKKITQKEIHGVLRSQNPTQIYALYAKIYGKVESKFNVVKWAEQHAPTKKIAKNAFNLLVMQFYGGVDSEYKAAKHGVFEPLRFGAIINELKHQINRGLDSYTKVFFVYNNNLILASPIYGSKDYNKTYLLRIDDVKTMRFAELIVSKCVKHFNYNPNKYIQQ